MSTAECGGVHKGKREEEPTQTVLQIIKGRERTRVTVFCRSTDFIVWSVVSSCSIGVQNQNKRPKNEYNMAPLMKIMITVFCKRFWVSNSHKAEVYHIRTLPRSFPNCTQIRLCLPVPGRWWWSERQRYWQRKKGRPQSRPHRRWTFLCGSLDWDPGLQMWHPQSASRRCKDNRTHHKYRWDINVLH